MRLLGWTMWVCVLAACGREGLDQAEAPSPSTLLVNALDGDDARVDLTVTARDGRLTAERSLLTQAGGMSMDRLPIPAGTYAWAIKVSGSDGAIIGTVEAQVVIADDMPAYVKVVFGHEGPVRIVADRAPRIDTVEVASDGQGRVRLTASPTDPDGDRVTIRWSASAIDPAVAPGDTITLEDRDLDRSNDIVNLVVQDQAGAIAVGRVLFQPRGGCALCGSHDVHTVALSAEGDRCGVAQASCVATCDRPFPRGQEAEAARCYDGCAAALALCLVDN